MTNITKSVSAAERKKLPHAGPHGSFPLKPSLLKAAWDLAGHAANPGAVRAKIRAYAAKHGLTSHLPKTAQLSKATSDAMRDVLGQAYNSTMSGGYQREKLLRTAANQSLLHLLPPGAHADLHQFHIGHRHESQDGIVPTFDGEDEAEPGGGHDPDDEADPYLHHAHTVSKAFNPKATNGSIVKAWDEDGVLHIEGWMSTPDRDLEKDITEPEAFKDGPLENYFTRAAPLSLEHNTGSLPVGHLQKAAIIRNGKVLETAQHPSDPAEFAHLPSSGSGVWVCGVITEEPAKSAVVKGNVAGMSFIGNFTRYEPLPGGGKRYLRIDPLVESTVAAYPVNTKAAFSRVQKALGMDNDELDLVALLEEAAKRQAAKEAAEETPKEETVTKAQVADLFAAFEKRLSEKLDSALASVDDKVQKAQVPDRGEGQGRKGGAPADQREADPAGYLVAKAADPASLDTKDRDLMFQLTKALIFSGSPAEIED